ncbi:MAG TPA: glycosyltransferase family 9 protein [Burkholderiaceae bacterium]|jgi:hypothetical protein
MRVENQENFFHRKLMGKLARIPPLREFGISKLVVFRALQVGDMLCAVPALRALRQALPHTHITLAGLPWAEEFAQRFSRYVDGFISFPGHPAFPEQAVHEELLPAFYRTMQTLRFDFAIQMHGDGRVSNQVVGAFGARRCAGYCAQDRLHEFDSRLFTEYTDRLPEPLRLLHLVRFLGAPSMKADLEFPITARDEAELKASGLHATVKSRNYVCVHPGARNRTKCWPPWLFAKIADQLAKESGVDIVLTGSGKEIDLTTDVAQKMRHKAINAAAPISIGAMAALMRLARLLVCNDTGVSHIAAGLRLPSVVIFNNSDMHRWAPLDRERHRCVMDPHGTRAELVLNHARALLAKNA